MSEYNEQPFELPSKGEAYDGAIPGTIKIRPFEAGDHRSMASAGDAVEMYRLILARVIRTPKVDVEKLLMGDVTAILVMSRILTMGGDYQVKYNCSECDSRLKAKMNLESLITQKSDDPALEAYGGFKVNDIEIEVGTHTFTCHLGRLEDEAKIQQIIRGKKRKDEIGNEQVDRTYLRMASLIDKIDGVEMRAVTQKLAFLDHMHPDEYDKLTEELNKRDVGILSFQYVPCKVCGEENRVRMELDAEFFRAVSRREGADRSDAV